MCNNELVARETSSKMDVGKLIAEVKKRPQLWDVRSPEYLDRSNTPQAWHDVAELLNSDVEACKKKWKNLRDAYRAEVRRSERRIAANRMSGIDDDKNAVSKWAYFNAMSFVSDSKRVRHSHANSAVINEGNTSSHDAHSNGSDVHLYDYDIKMEPHHLPSDDEHENEKADMLLKAFNEATTPQAVRRLSETLSLGNATDDENTTDQSSDMKSERRRKVSTEQVHFLEDLEREEQILMQSTRQDISRCNPVKHIGDADYNFLISFWPHMKKMTDLQNIQFRAKMSDLLLNTLAQTNAVTTSQPENPEPQAAPQQMLTQFADDSSENVENLEKSDLVATSSSNWN